MGNEPIPTERNVEDHLLRLEELGDVAGLAEVHRAGCAPVGEIEGGSRGGGRDGCRDVWALRCGVSGVEQFMRKTYAPKPFRLLRE